MMLMYDTSTTNLLYKLIKRIKKLQMQSHNKKKSNTT